MARNKFDVDERLETPFQWKHFKRAGKYIARHKYKMLLALLLSALSSMATLYIPKITVWVLDEAVPNKDTAMIGRMNTAWSLKPKDSVKYKTERFGRSSMAKATARTASAT